MKQTFPFFLAAPFVLLAAFGLSAQAAPVSRVLPSSAASSKPSLPSNNTSWMFLLETRSQWLLIIQDKDQNPHLNDADSGVADSALGPLGSQSSNTSVSGGATTGQSFGSKVAGTPSAATGTGTTEDDIGGSARTTIILEGNTLVLPLEPDEPPIKPSAKSS